MDGPLQCLWGKLKKKKKGAFDHSLGLSWPALGTTVCVRGWETEKRKADLIMRLYLSVCGCLYFCKLIHVWCVCRSVPGRFEVRQTDNYILLGIEAERPNNQKTSVRSDMVTADGERWGTVNAERFKKYCIFKAVSYPLFFFWGGGFCKHCDHKNWSSNVFENMCLPINVFISDVLFPQVGERVLERRKQRAGCAGGVPFFCTVRRHVSHHSIRLFVPVCRLNGAFLHSRRCSLCIAPAPASLPPACQKHWVTRGRVLYRPRASIHELAAWLLVTHKVPRLGPRS